jgi:hypothetical protein
MAAGSIFDNSGESVKDLKMTEAFLSPSSTGTVSKKLNTEELKKAFGVK